MKSNNLFAKGIVLVLFVFGISESQAQVSFKPGFRGGANFSHFTKDNDYYYNDYNGSGNGDNLNDDFSSRTAFYVGFYGALKLTKYYTLQPEIDYSAQGAKYKNDGNKTENFNVDYLSFEILNKFTFDRLNIHFGPTLDFVVDKNFDTDSDVDLAFVLGMGFNITQNFGIEARVKKGIIPMVDFSSNRSNVVFSIGGNYTFDIK